MLNLIRQSFRSKTCRKARLLSRNAYGLKLEALEVRRMLTIDLSTVVSNLGFEENSSVPDSLSQINRLDSWSQLSGGTTDYLHNDGYLLDGIDGFAPPTTSGDGFIGLRARYGFGGGALAEDFFEYAVNELDEPLLADQQYQFDLFVGARLPTNFFAFPPHAVGFTGELVVYGLVDSSEIPTYSSTTVTIESFAGQNLVELESVDLDLPANEWRTIENFTFTTPPDTQLEAIVFGPRTNQSEVGIVEHYLLVDLAPPSDSNCCGGGVDTLPPQVTNVTIGNSANASETFDFVAEDAHGSGKQILQLPFQELDTIQIEFSEQVMVGEDALQLISNNMAGYQLDYQGLDAAGTTATWQLATGVFETLDMILLDLSDSITDIAGNALDGEWTNPQRTSTTNSLVSEFPSGDGVAGGDFRFAITANIPGDVTGDNLVNSADLGIVLNNFGLEANQVTGWQTNLPDDTVDSEEIGLVLNDFNKGSLDWLLLGDLNTDYWVGSHERLQIRRNWGGPDRVRSQGDFNGDGNVDAIDRAVVSGLWNFRVDFVD